MYLINPKLDVLLKVAMLQSYRKQSEFTVQQTGVRGSSRSGPRGAGHGDFRLLAEEIIIFFLNEILEDLV